MNISYLIPCFVAISLSTVSALTSKQTKWLLSELEETVDECRIYHDVTLEQLENFKQFEGGEKLDPCFVECFLKKINMIDDNGDFVPEAGVDHLRSLLYTEFADFSTFRQIGRKCLQSTFAPNKENCELSRQLLQCASINSLWRHVFDVSEEPESEGCKNLEEKISTQEEKRLRDAFKSNPLEWNSKDLQKFNRRG